MSKLSKLPSFFDKQGSEDINLVFIGMSGTGKSHWSSLIHEQYGLPLYSVDEIIGETPEFKSLIADINGISNVERLGKFFGMPWEEGFEDKEKAFLETEALVMDDCATKKASIIDTGGSAIYSPQAMDKLQKNGIVVYLQIPLGKNTLTLQDFMGRPRPVCWNGHYHQRDNETHEQAFDRCYEELLAARAQKYEDYADLIVPNDIHKNAQDPRELVDYMISEARK